VYRCRRARHKGSSRSRSRAALRAGAPLSRARRQRSGLGIRRMRREIGEGRHRSLKRP
jgi:hypothetical protein